MVQVRVPEGSGTRKGTDVCCIIDISGSMGAAATYEDPATGEEKNDGLTLLDIVQHAVKTLIKTLQPADRLSLVTFNESAALELELTAMTEAGQEQAVAKLMTFRAYGRTNIWDGVLKGMESLRGPSDPNHDRGESGRNDGRQKAILLLTELACSTLGARSLSAGCTAE